MSLEELLAEIDATQPLAKAKTETLLTAYAALTHRIGSSERLATYATPYDLRHAERVADLRKQRDLIRAEILRRTGDL